MSFESEAIRNLVERRSSAPLVASRLDLNEIGNLARITQEDFWSELVMSLLSSQQPSGEKSQAERFRGQVPFPLDLAAYETLADQEVYQILSHFRFNKKIPTYLRSNYDWIFGNNGHWSLIEAKLLKLLNQRNLTPDPNHQELERTICNEFAGGALKLRGVGPKQSRNLLQSLGLTRYEIPLDSRVTAWLKCRLGWDISKTALSDSKQYDELLNRVQAICADANVLPAIFDAAAFEDAENLKTSTTCPGYVNRNGQVVIRNTHQPGTDKNQYVYQLGCSHCGNVYGANGSDIHLRLCPGCQAGANGLAIE